MCTARSLLYQGRVSPRQRDPPGRRPTSDRDPLIEPPWTESPRTDRKWHHTETPLWTDKYFWKTLPYPKNWHELSKTVNIKKLKEHLAIHWISDLGSFHLKQECIPVGCIPPAAVAIMGGLHMPLLPGSRPPWSRHPPGADPPQVWAWRPPLGQIPSTSPWVWTWRPPWPDPLQLPPWVWAWKPTRHAGIPPPLETCCKACWDTKGVLDTPPPREQNHRQL